MRVYLETLGCRLNFAEMAALGRQLTGAGHHVVGSASEADVCVLNSCAVTGEAARKSRQVARQLARSNPSARLVVTGCYATLEGETVGSLPNVVLVVGNERKEALMELLMDSLAPDESTGTEAAEPTAERLSNERTRAFVKVQDGCHNRCTFCIVTVARGAERSRPMAQVVAEINALHAAGYQEAVLTGVHLGAYGRDFGGALRSLVETIIDETAIPRLRLSSLEPFDLAPDFFDLWEGGSGRLMPHLHLPAQSGSDNVLRRMARRNRVADFEALLDAARSRVPDLVVTTDLIAGFPGESEEDFAQTVAFARRARFGHMHVFPYSARAGTAAARMSGQVPEAERRRRSHILNLLDAEMGEAARSEFLGQVRPVLWENAVMDRTAPPGTTVWEGLTDNYLPVRTATLGEDEIHNCVLPTRLLDLRNEHLWGELVR